MPLGARKRWAPSAILDFHQHALQDAERLSQCSNLDMGFGDWSLLLRRRCGAGGVARDFVMLHFLSPAQHSHAPGREHSLSVRSFRTDQN
jgi:hypothetical protein